MAWCILLCLCWISSVGASHFFVTAPNVLPFNHDEKVLVSVFGESNFNVKIWLEIQAGKKFSQKSVTVLNEKNPIITTIKVTENDLFPDDKIRKKPTFVRLFAKTSKGKFSQKILLTYNTGYIVLHTSKPVYHPKDKVNVRALAMTESLAYARGWNISMDIISPKNLTFGRNTKTDFNKKFFSDSFTLPPHATPGTWEIKAHFRGQFTTKSRTFFRVEEYVLPRFGVTVNVEERVILEGTENIHIQVQGKYVYNKPVKGKAYIKLSLVDKDDNVKSLGDPKTLNLNEGIGKFVVSVQELIDSAGGFPDGQYLQVNARVIDKTTGKEEEAGYRNSLFSKKKYKFSFDMAKKFYHPGLSYYLRFSISLANGDHPGKLDFIATDIKTGTEKDGVTEENGYGLAIFGLSARIKEKLQFRISTGNEQSELLEIDTFQGAGGDFIRIGQGADKGDMIVTATTTIKVGENAAVNEYTGIMVMFLSRGRYIEHMVLDPSTDPSEPVPKALQEKMSPEGRVVGFFVNTRTGKVVADSSKIIIQNPSCPDKGLKLEPEVDQPVPDAMGLLNIHGSPHMTVGLNAMDKALLLLDNKNVLRKNKMFEVLKSHDLGCGEGGGRNTEHVFRDAGLVVVTDAGLNSADLERKSFSCGGHSRKKRNIYCDNSNKFECCSLGEEHADDILANQLPEPLDRCYEKTMTVSKLKDEKNPDKYRYSYSCLQYIYYRCLEVVKDSIGDVDIIGKSWLDDSDDFLDVLKEFRVDDIYTRRDFRDSWLFQEVELDKDGKKEIGLNFPSSITEWMIQGIGINEGKGFCIAEPANKTITLPFFLKVDMPYAATRLEYFELVATVYYYGNNNKTLKVAVTMEKEDDLCIGKKGIISFNLKPNNGRSVRIPILPLKAKKYKITVTAAGSLGASKGLSDRVEKDLVVINEGIELRQKVTVCLNPTSDYTLNDCDHSDSVTSKIISGVQTATVKLDMPDNAIEGTGSAYAYLSSDVMTDVVRKTISGIGNMLRQPKGCGEQTMIYLGPSVYVMNYWKQTNQMTSENEIKGNNLIRDGVKRELTYRKGDGSYGAWLSTPSSTWLTAFVAKVFCQAKKVVDDSVTISQDVVSSIKWISKKQNNNGAFYDPKPVYHQEMIGQIEETDPSLTAFVLIAMLECQTVTNTERSKKKAVDYLEGLSDSMYNQNPYLLAISTYAVYMANGAKKDHLLEKLWNNKNRNQNGAFYWGNAGGFPASKDAVETTAYALLAFLEAGQIERSANIVRWLISNREASGSFRTTQDTVIGLQALAKYRINTYNTDTKLTVKLNAHDWEGVTRRLTSEHSEVLEVIDKIPVQRKKNQITVTVEGSGKGMLTFDYRYNRRQNSSEQCRFKVSDIIVKQVHEIDFPIEEQFGRKCDEKCGCDHDNDENDGEINDDPELQEPLEVQAHVGRDKRNANDDNADDANAKKFCVKFSVASLDDTTEHGMSIVDVGLETGVTVDEDDLKEYKENGLIDNYEIPTNGFFILYLDKITSQPKEFVFRLIDNFKGEDRSRQPTAIKVYDYYRPEFDCIKFYGTGERSGSPVEYKCGEGANREACSCLETICPKKNWGDILREEAKKGNAPAKRLADGTCEYRKTDFAAIVKVDKAISNFTTSEISTSATVVKVIHEGTQSLKVNSKLQLSWRLYCSDLVEDGKTYYIITKDGGRKIENTDGSVIFSYQIMGTTVVVEYSEFGTKRYTRQQRRKFTQEQKKELFLQSIMSSYELKMKDGCKQ